MSSFSSPCLPAFSWSDFFSFKLLWKCPSCLSVHGGDPSLCQRAALLSVTFCVWIMKSLSWYNSLLNKLGLYTSHFVFWKMYGALLLLLCCDLLKMDGRSVVLKRVGMNGWLFFSAERRDGWSDYTTAPRKGLRMDDSPSLLFRGGRTNIFG